MAWPPRAYLNDGLLDVMMIKEFPLNGIKGMLDELSDIDSPGNEYIFYRQTPHCRLEIEDERPLNLDGEPTLVKKVDFRIKPQSLRVILTPETEMLKKTSSRPPDDPK